VSPATAAAPAIAAESAASAARTASSPIRTAASAVPIRETATHTVASTTTVAAPDSFRSRPSVLTLFIARRPLRTRGR
jgi:hypothetical protein